MYEDVLISVNFYLIIRSVTYRITEVLKVKRQILSIISESDKTSCDNVGLDLQNGLMLLILSVLNTII